MFIPIKPIIAGEFKFKKRIVNTKDYIGQYKNKTAVKSYKHLNLSQMTERIQKGQSWQKYSQLSYDNSESKDGHNNGEDRNEIEL